LLEPIKQFWEKNSNTPQLSLAQIEATRPVVGSCKRYEERLGDSKKLAIQTLRKLSIVVIACKP
jgi:hypothetical protein